MAGSTATLLAGLAAASACGRYGPPVRPAAVALTEPAGEPGAPADSEERDEERAAGESR